MTRDNLNTDGLEFALPDGSAYSGPYHIHIDNGAMVGARHSTTPHSNLIPVNNNVALKVSSIQNELRAQQIRENKIQSISSQTNVRSSGSSSGSSGGGGGGY
tara:strand:- start:2587 stop:2892 length:306 start_codon:yes stop_codon:yes gene_type:complete